MLVTYFAARTCYALLDTRLFYAREIYKPTLGAVAARSKYRAARTPSRE
jgi:hypothetical protein